MPWWYGDFYYFARYLAHSNSAINPLIYAGFNENFQKGEGEWGQDGKREEGQERALDGHKSSACTSMLLPFAEGKSRALVHGGQQGRPVQIDHLSPGVNEGADVAGGWMSDGWQFLFVIVVVVVVVVVVLSVVVEEEDENKIPHVKFHFLPSRDSLVYIESFRRLVSEFKNLCRNKERKRRYTTMVSRADSFQSSTHITKSRSSALTVHSLPSAGSQRHLQQATVIQIRTSTSSSSLAGPVGSSRKCTVIVEGMGELSLSITALTDTTNKRENRARLIASYVENVQWNTYMAIFDVQDDALLQQMNWKTLEMEKDSEREVGMNLICFLRAVVETLAPDAKLATSCVANLTRS
ncbi:hypothetical protein C0Q70_00458 [Pomacea canaliculata]|uniref:Uncharacterized protein n=1 Tax=Pomacea canaliculata TaxID=400727 RepID=A0A2T7PWP6_POMCA|nr:hypothetical protein C0Q70_00458 [Pomacea canaliculata]